MQQHLYVLKRDAGIIMVIVIACLITLGGIIGYMAYQMEKLEARVERNEDILKEREVRKYFKADSNCHAPL